MKSPLKWNKSNPPTQQVNVSDNVNPVVFQNVQHLLGWEDRDEILHILGYRLVLDQEYVLNRVVAKVYPSWAGHPRWIARRRELYLKDTRWMLSRARAEPLTISMDGVLFRGSRLASNEYRHPGDFRKVCQKVVSFSIIN